MGIMFGDCSVWNFGGTCCSCPIIFMQWKWCFDITKILHSISHFHSFCYIIMLVIRSIVLYIRYVTPDILPYGLLAVSRMTLILFGDHRLIPPRPMIFYLSSFLVASHTDILRLVTCSSLCSPWGGTHDKPKNVCVGCYISGLMTSKKYVRVAPTT